MEYIRNYYKVPAKRGAKIQYKGQNGTIVGALNGCLRVRLEGEKKIKTYHPTWEIKYL